MKKKRQKHEIAFKTCFTISNDSRLEALPVIVDMLSRVKRKKEGRQIRSLGGEK